MQIYKTLKPLVSVVIPTFNRASYLQRSINSVLKQSFTDWELLIVDDGSSDATFNVVNEYISRFENIRYLKHSNRKPALSTNVGVLASCGEYLAFIGSDDEYKPDHLKLRVEFMKKNPAIDFIHGGVEIIGSPYVKDKNDLTKEIHLSECAIGGTFFGKRKIFLELGGFRNLYYSDDSDFFERVQKEFKIAQVDFPTYIYYRDTPDSICTTIE
ncbi:MAG: glycosyltransferase family 2 protein [Bacteroidetes bacterium]|nr:glycosyltransferase family 2 protein [Bacteroidota bacterium]